jgi:hypothetical protein
LWDPLVSLNNIFLQRRLHPLLDLLAGPRPPLDLPAALPLLQAKTLLLVGCFLVEFFLKAKEVVDDVLVDAVWAMQNVYNDLFLLEK